MDLTTPVHGLTQAHLLQIKDHVVPLVRQVGQWAKSRQRLHFGGQDQLTVDIKTVPGDVVTEVDVEAQRRIVESLSREFPEFGLLGEEDLSQSAVADAPIWVIDPVDGTHNFVRGYPDFCVSIGLVVEGKSVLGAIYDAGTDTVYWAAKGEGAWREDQRISLTPRPLMHSLITTNFTQVNRGNVGHRDFFVGLASSCSGVRASGSACRDFCFIADGTVDLFWQFGLKAWDVAAGMIIVEEAGGAVHTLNDASDWLQGGPLDLVVGAPSLLEEVLAVGLPLLSGTESA